MIIEGIYIVFCLLLALYNKRRIAYDKHINHGLNGALHIIFLAVAVIITKSWFPVAALPFIGRVFFDGSLNLMRHLPLGYVSSKPKSIIDKGEKSVFGNNGVLPKVIWLAIAISLNIIFYARHSFTISP
jgi:hypothetical protein